MGASTEGWKIRSEIAPEASDPVIHKRYPDAFADTALEAALAERGIGNLVLTGAQSDCCVRATTYRALSEGYDVTLVSDCHTTEDAEFAGTVIPSELIVAHVNSRSPWIIYPDTTSNLATHDEIIASLKAPALID